MAGIREIFLERYENVLEQVAAQIASDLRQRAPVDTGALKNSIQWNVLQDGTIAIYYNRYGVYQDLGVKGWDNQRGPNASPFQYKRNNANNTAARPGPVGGDFGTFGARVNIRKLGLRAQYWATNPTGEPYISPEVARIMEEQIAAGIEAAVKTTTDRLSS